MSNRTARLQFNQYRQGVLIGNFVEDIYGTDLRGKYQNESNSNLPQPKIPISEAMDQFTWPHVKERDIKAPGNELTMKCNSNFDLNIDFTKKNCQDFLNLAKDNEYVLDNKNAFLPNEIKSEFAMKKYNATQTGIPINDSIFNQTQRRLKGFHMNDTTGVLYTKKLGWAANLWFGHSLKQENFKTNELSSTYNLTLDKKIRTDTFYNPHYTVKTPLNYQPKTKYDDKDWGFRKFKTYEDFTKRIDKATCLEK